MYENVLSIIYEKEGVFKGCKNSYKMTAPRTFTPRLYFYATMGGSNKFKKKISNSLIFIIRKQRRLVIRL